MPYAAKQPCPGCGRAVARGLCDTCKALRPARVSSSKRGYDRRWRKTRRAHLDANPMCKDTYDRHPGVCVLATDVDHIEACTPDSPKFYDPANHQSLCHECHSYKTVTVDGGFGKERLRTSTRPQGDRGVENIQTFGA